MVDGSDGPKGKPGTQQADPRVEEAKRRAEIAEANQREIEAELESERARLGMEKAKLESDLTLLKTRGEAAQALLPEPKTSPLGGEISVYDQDAKLGYAAELVAYRAIDELAADAAKMVCARGTLDISEGEDPDQNPAGNAGQRQGAAQQGAPPKPVVLVVAGDPDAYAYEAMTLVEVRAQLAAHEEALRDRSNRNDQLLAAIIGGEEAGEGDGEAVPLLADPATLALFLGAAPRAVGAIADVASYFLADYGIKERDFDVDRRGLISAVAGALRGRGVDVRLPGLLEVEDSPLLTKFAQLQRLAVRLRIGKDSLSSFAQGSLSEEVARLKRRADDAEKGGASGPNPGQARSGERSAAEATADPIREEEPAHDVVGVAKQDGAELEAELGAAQRRLDETKAAVLGSEATLAAFDGFCTAVTAPQEGQPAAKLAQAIVREKLGGANVTHLLWIDVLSSGGEAVTKRTRWPWSTGQISLMGGAAVAYVLATKAGEVVAAKTLTRMGVLERPLFGGQSGERITIL